MMLELLMTRQNSLDQAVISNARIWISLSLTSFTLIAGVKARTWRCSFDDFEIACAGIAAPSSSARRQLW
jgi:hypothetical protein